MPTKKGVKLTPTQNNKLKTIKNSPSRDKKLQKLSTASGIPIAKLKQRWYYHNSNGHNITKTTPVTGGKKMVLVIDTVLLRPRTKTDAHEAARLQQALDVVVPKLMPLRGNIPIESKYSGAARNYLDVKYPGSKFVFSVERRAGKPTGITRIFKK